MQQQHCNISFTNFYNANVPFAMLGNTLETMHLIPLNALMISAYTITQRLVCVVRYITFISTVDRLCIYTNTGLAFLFVTLTS